MVAHFVRAILCFDAFSSREPVPTSLENALLYCSNTAAQAGLRLVFCRRRQAVMARALGISPAQSR